MDRPLNLLKYLQTIKVIYQKKILEFLSWEKHRKYTRFIIISQPRVGSTLLLSYLNNHPQVIVKGEIVREKKLNLKYRNISIVDFLEDTVYKKYHKSIKAVGFKYFYEHQSLEPELLNYIIAHNDIKIIHLKRRDLLRTYVSNKISEKTGVWSITKFEKDKPLHTKRIKFENEDYIQYKSNIEKEYENFKKNFLFHCQYHIYYEDLVKDKNKKLSEIQSFLLLENKSLITLLDKQNPEALNDLLINHGVIGNQ